MRRKYFWKLPLTRAPVVNWSTTVNFALSYLPSVPSCWQFRRCWHSLGRMFTNWQLMRDIGHVLQLFGELWCFRETLSSSEHTFDVHLHCFVSSSDWPDAFDIHLHCFIQIASFAYYFKQCCEWSSVVSLIVYVYVCLFVCECVCLSVVVFEWQLMYRWLHGEA